LGVLGGDEESDTEPLVAPHIQRLPQSQPRSWRRQKFRRRRAADHRLLPEEPATPTARRRSVPERRHPSTRPGRNGAIARYLLNPIAMFHMPYFICHMKYGI